MAWPHATSPRRYAKEGGPLADKLQLRHDGFRAVFSPAPGVAWLGVGLMVSTAFGLGGLLTLTGSWGAGMAALGCGSLVAWGLGRGLVSPTTLEYSGERLRLSLHGVVHDLDAGQIRAEVVREQGVVMLVLRSGRSSFRFAPLAWGEAELQALADWVDALDAEQPMPPVPAALTRLRQGAS